MLSLSLKQAGYRVQSASNGLEALELLKGAPFDWLVTDGRMSPMDGLQLSLQAKKLRPKLHIVMISAVYDEGDASGYPIDKFFAKPVPVDALVGWLSRDAGPGVARPPAPM